LTRSARVQVLFSCWGQRHRLSRRPAQLELDKLRAGIFRATRVRGAAGVGVPHRRGDRRERDAESLRELVRPPCVQLRLVERAFLALARAEVRCLRELRDLALRRRAPVPPLELGRAGAQVRGDGLPARGEQAHHLSADALDLEPVPVVAGDPVQAEPGSEGFLEVLGGDRGDRADVLVVAERVWGSPLPVDGRAGDVGDLGVDVQLHVAVA
jgi:hypothetical protein